MPERIGYIVALASRVLVHNSSGHGFLWNSDKSYVWVRAHMCVHTHTHTQVLQSISEEISPIKTYAYMFRLLHLENPHIEHSAYWYKNPFFLIMKLSSHNVSTIPSLEIYPLPYPTSVFFLIFSLINLFSIPSQLCFSPSVPHMP